MAKMYKTIKYNKDIYLLYIIIFNLSSKNSKS